MTAALGNSSPGGANPDRAILEAYLDQVPRAFVETAGPDDEREDAARRCETLQSKVPDLLALAGGLEPKWLEDVRWLGGRRTAKSHRRVWEPAHANDKHACV